MRDDVRQVLQELWERRNGRLSVESGMQVAVRRIWKAHGYNWAPCKWCWYRAHDVEFPGDDGKLEPHEYDPVEDW